ncbi:unnamed protein product [Menidia menidia]|uniref:(Atlantic silverside) hypothetical protein n=1 Tax=Menidia menidia TaxID=238744 RepID=A0A8S4BKV4_9TELE|nr:unnamed protein product [Menidia menidia]
MQKTKRETQTKKKTPPNEMQQTKRETRTKKKTPPNEMQQTKMRHCSIFIPLLVSHLILRWPTGANAQQKRKHANKKENTPE